MTAPDVSWAGLGQCGPSLGREAPPLQVEAKNFSPPDAPALHHQPTFSRLPQPPPPLARQPPLPQLPRLGAGKQHSLSQLAGVVHNCQFICSDLGRFATPTGSVGEQRPGQAGWWRQSAGQSARANAQTSPPTSRRASRPKRIEEAAPAQRSVWRAATGPPHSIWAPGRRGDELNLAPLNLANGGRAPAAAIGHDRVN